MKLLLLGLVACGAAPVPPPPAASPLVPPIQLTRIVKQYWDDYLQLNSQSASAAGDTRFDNRLGNKISPQYLADSLALERRYLRAVSSVSRTALDADLRLSFDIFKAERELNIEGYTYPAELLPVNPFEGMAQQFIREASAAGWQSPSNVRDYDNWLARINDFVQWTDQAIANMREGLRRGYTLPRIVVEKTLPQLEHLAEDTPTNPFYIRGHDKTPLTMRLNSAVKDRILPAYRQLHDFLQKEYLPRARTTVALSALPLGESWYAFLIKRETSSRLTAPEIHSLGLAEVARLRSQLQAMLVVNPITRWPPRSYANAQDLVAGYQTISRKIATATPALFSLIPQADFDIRAATGFGNADMDGAKLYYRRATPDGKSPAVLLVNAADISTYPSFRMESLFLQEAVPGHHYQLTLQQERLKLPRFRRFGSAPAFVEGWGLYAVSLGEELGIFRDADSKIGSIVAQLECAIGLVIDTGVHAKGWTRPQALEYVRAQTPPGLADLNAIDANIMVDRSIALPGQALACKIGELRIRALRSRAQSSMGARFDIRAFHAEILQDGAMPLDILAAKIEEWIKSSNTAH